MLERRTTIAAAAALVAACVAGFLLFREPPAARRESPRASAGEPTAATESGPAPRVEPERGSPASEPRPTLAGGAVEVTVRDAAGEPLAGVEIELLPPIVAGDDWTRAWLTESEARHPVVDEWTGTPRRSVTPPRRFDRNAVAALATEDWIRATDAAGRVAWRDLEPMDGYRVGIRSTVAGARVDPPHEWAATGEIPPPGLSGRIEIVRGATARVAATVAGETSARGWLMAASGDPAVDVELTLEHVAHDGTRTSEASGWTGARGEFEFGRLAAGRKALRAFFEKPPGHFHWIDSPFDVALGQSIDVGAVAAGRHTVEGVVRYVDDGGVTIPVADLFPPASAPYWHTIDLAGPTGLPDEAACALPASFGITVEDEKPFFLHGLAEGRLVTAPPVSVGIRPMPRDGERVRIHEEAGAAIVVPESTLLDVAIRVERVALATLVVEPPSDAPPQNVQVYFLGESPSSRFEIHQRSSSGTSKFRYPLHAPAGRYRVLAYSEPTSRSGRTESYFAEADVRVADGAEIVIPMRPAASLAITVDESDGRALDPNESVVVGFPPWSEGEDPRWPYRSARDRSGRYVIRGLPPRRRIEVRDSVDSVETGDANEELDATVRIR